MDIKITDTSGVTHNIVEKDIAEALEAAKFINEYIRVRLTDSQRAVLGYSNDIDIEEYELNNIPDEDLDRLLNHKLQIKWVAYPWEVSNG